MSTEQPPPNDDELAKYVQFRLSALAEENAHHRFEELCFRVAKATVATNLIPPTGPVAAGGDQGRDFESYRVAGDGGAVTTRFASCVKGEDTLVFCCTTLRGEPADLAAKVRGDLDTACAREPRPTVAYYYLASRTLPPATRHSLQDWAKRTHSLHLELQDQRTIAEILSERPNRWLAQHYLQVPSEMLRTSEPEPTAPAWYREARDRFADPAIRRIVTQGELALLVRCVRHAWGPLKSKADDGLWLDILSGMWGAPGGFETEAGVRAFYEMFVFLLRGRERCGMEEHVSAYVDAVLSLDDLALSHDIFCFASYLVGGVQHGVVKMPLSKAIEQFNRLRGWVDRHIETAPGPVVRSDLLIARGAMVAPSFARADDEITATFVENVATETLSWWTRALDVGEGLNSFPILYLREMVTNIVPVLCESPQYDEFVARLDKASDGRLAGAALAASTRDRAMALFKAGKHVDALGPMLAARRLWHNGDHIRGSLLASTMAAECLHRAGLLWAAKRTLYDTISVCNRVGAKDHADIVVQALFLLGEIEYVMGDWATAALTYRFALALHVQFTADAWNFAEHRDLQAASFHLVNMVVGGEMVAPGFRKWALEVAAGWDLGDLLAKFEETVRGNWQAQGLLDGPTPDDFPLTEPPLADTQPIRSARWSALGCRWLFRWRNDYATEAAAMEVVTTVQLMQVALGRRYKHLIPCDVRVSVQAWESGKSAVEEVAGEPGVTIIARVPAWEDPRDPTRDRRAVAMYVATRVLGAASVDDDVDEVLAKVSGELVRNAIFVGASPSEGREQVFPERAWEKTLSAPRPAGRTMNVPARTCPELPWPDGASPRYGVEEAAEKNLLRHEFGFKSAAPVLRAYSSNERFRGLVDDLRREGWLDWQIASALAPAATSSVTNARRQADRRAPDGGRAARAEMEAIRLGKYEAPPWSVEFERAVRGSLLASLFAALQAWGLGIRHPTPDVDAVRRFLQVRFHHFEDGTPAARRGHFPWEPPPGEASGHGVAPKNS